MESPIKGINLVHHSKAKLGNVDTTNRSKDYSLKLHMPSNSMHISAALARDFGIVINRDSVGFFWDKEDPYICFMYFTSRKDNTALIRKYPKNPYKIFDNFALETLLRKFHFKHWDKTNRLLVMFQKPIKVNVGGVIEELYLIYDEPDSREDLTPEERAIYKARLKQSLLKVLNPQRK